MDVEQELSLEERLAQAMIDMRKGPSSNTTAHQKREHLITAIEEVKKDIDLIKQENEILNDLRGRTDSTRNRITPVGEIDPHLTPVKHGKCHNTRDFSVQTEPVSYIYHKAEKFKLINSLTTREKMLQEKLKNLQLTVDCQENYLLLKLTEYDDLINEIESMTPDEITPYDGDIELENVSNFPSLTISNYSTSGLPPTTTSPKIGVSSNSGLIRLHEEADDEGVRLLLSMKSNVFNCKCGEYLNSITDWSEHQRICSESTEKTIGEQCQICKKTFKTDTALNIHSTKKHNKKKVRTDSVMHCPCGQSFTAKWRQNCVHKLNSHGRHCKAFKDVETQCSICKKGFIDRKSLEYHGLKAHKLAVPVSS